MLACVERIEVASCPVIHNQRAALLVHHLRVTKPPPEVADAFLGRVGELAVAVARRALNAVYFDGLRNVCDAQRLSVKRNPTKRPARGVHCRAFSRSTKRCSGKRPKLGRRHLANLDAEAAYQPRLDGA